MTIFLTTGSTAVALLVIQVQYEHVRVIEIAWHLPVRCTQQTITSAPQWKQNWKCKNKYKKYDYAWGSEILCVRSPVTLKDDRLCSLPNKEKYNQ